MRITIEIKSQYVSGIANALCNFYDRNVTEDEVIKFIESHINADYEAMSEHTGFDEVVADILQG